MKFGHIELFVQDPEASKDFFIDVLGFTLVSFQNPNTIWIKLDNTEFLLRKGKKSVSKTYQDASSGFVIYTDNLQESQQKLEHNGLIFEGIDGSDKCLTFQDIDGHWFQLVNPHDH